MIDRKRLLAFTNPERYAASEPPLIPVAPQQKPSAGRPESWGVLYAEPNADGRRKACSNCAFWATSQQCSIHKETVYISAQAVCGYHVTGTPSDVRAEIPGLEPVEPQFSGLVTVPGGTSCDRCKWYDPELDVDDRGFCRAVNTPEGMPAPVQSLGCCARWEKR